MSTARISLANPTETATVWKYARGIVTLVELLGLGFVVIFYYSIAFMWWSILSIVEYVWTTDEGAASRKMLLSVALFCYGVTVTNATLSAALPWVLERLSR